MTKSDRFTNSKASDRVYSSSGTEFGVRTGGSRMCGMEGCSGRAVAVRWQTGNMSYPCSSALEARPDGAVQISRT